MFVTFREFNRVRVAHCVRQWWEVHGLVPHHPHRAFAELFLLDLYHVISEDVLSVVPDRSDRAAIMQLSSSAFMFEPDSFSGGDWLGNLQDLRTWHEIARPGSTIESIKALMERDDLLSPYVGTILELWKILTGEWSPSVDVARDVFLDVPSGLMRFIAVSLARRRELRPETRISAKLSHMLLAAAAMHGFSFRVWAETRKDIEGGLHVQDPDNPVLSSSLVATSLSVMESVALSIRRDQRLDESQVELLASAVHALKRGVYKDR